MFTGLCEPIDGDTRNQSEDTDEIGVRDGRAMGFIFL